MISKRKWIARCFLVFVLTALTGVLVTKTMAGCLVCGSIQRSACTGTIDDPGVCTVMGMHYTCTLSGHPLYWCRPGYGTCTKGYCAGTCNVTIMGVSPPCNTGGYGC